VNATETRQYARKNQWIVFAPFTGTIGLWTSMPVAKVHYKRMQDASGHVFVGDRLNGNFPDLESMRTVLFRMPEMR
jgi:hypothetical protein